MAIDLSQYDDAELDAERVKLDEQIEELKIQLAEMNAEAGRRSLANHEAVQAALVEKTDAAAVSLVPEGSAAAVPDADVVH